MKKIALFILTIASLGHVFAQSDKNGNPVFNSVSTGEKVVDHFLLISNYYTLKNNIENKQSSVFISKELTLDEIEKASITLASDFFIITKESKIVAMVILQNDPKRAFMTIVMSNKKQLLFPCHLKGEITENRANEIIRAQYDTASRIEDGKLKFNGKTFEIISNDAIEEAVLALIKKEKLAKKKPSDIMLPSKNELSYYILTETKEGGKLDFFTEIKGHEYDGVQIKEGVFTTKQSVALYKWGRACYEIGVNTLADTYEIYAEFKGKPLNERDKEYIKGGFYKEWEQ
jgi:hypothetical protein